MELEELSEKEIEILEALTRKRFYSPSVKQIAKETDSKYQEVLGIIDNPELIENFKKSRMQKEREKKILNSKKIIEQEKKERETRILEAICDKGCRSITSISESISEVTGISYEAIRKVISNANLLPELREMRKKEEYEKVRAVYREGMTIEELVKITGIKNERVRIARKEKRIAEEELIQEQRNLAGILNQIMLKRAEKEDSIFCEAYAYYTRPSIKLSFKEIYKRFRDIAENYSVSECGRRWNMSRQASSIFIKSTGKHTF